MSRQLAQTSTSRQRLRRSSWPEALRPAAGGHDRRRGCGDYIGGAESALPTMDRERMGVVVDLAALVQGSGSTDLPVLPARAVHRVTKPTDTATAEGDRDPMPYRTVHNTMCGDYSFVGGLGYPNRRMMSHDGVGTGPDGERYRCAGAGSAGRCPRREFLLAEVAQQMREGGPRVHQVHRVPGQLVQQPGQWPGDQVGVSALKIPTSLIR